MIENLIKRIALFLDRFKIPYMIIGGQAVLLYGRARMTQDIDITLGVDIDCYKDIEKLCKNLQLKILPDKPLKFVKDTKVLPAQDGKTKFRVDFIFSNTTYEKEAIRRARRVKIKGHPVRFAAIEDLIIHKLFAGRAIDLEDVKGILTKQMDVIDLKYIRKWLREFSKLTETQDLLSNFERLLKKIK